MRKCWTIGLFVTLNMWASLSIAQPATPDNSVAYAGYELERNAMWSLGTWATTNVAAGAIGLASTDDPKWRAIHQMNLGWNLVNLALAGYSLATIQRDVQSPWHAYRRSQRLENMLLINTGLDVAYIVAGAWLCKRGVDTGNPVDHGWGQALVLQGVALLLFDAIVAWRQAQITDDTARALRGSL